MYSKLVAATLAAPCVSGIALAQSIPAAPQIAPRLTAQAAQQLAPNTALRNQPGVTFTPPVLTGLLLTAEQARKLNLIRSWGLTVPASALQPSIWLTPQRPYVDAQTNISAVASGRFPTTIDYAAAPYGTIRIPTVLNSSVSLQVASTPATWWLVECYVRSFPDTTERFCLSTHPFTGYADDTGPTDGSVITRMVTPSEGRIAVLFEPGTRPARTFILRPRTCENDWFFGGCELTPIRI